MKIALFDPYLDTLGGGEKYILTAAECLSLDHKVHVLWSGIDVRDEARKKFDLSLDSISFRPSIFQKSVVQKFRFAKEYDAIIYVSDGSFPYLNAKKNYLVFQFPVNWVNTRKTLVKLKLRKINGIICYSEFVKEHLQKKFSLPIHVIPPSIDAVSFREKKENVILSVGRFTKGMNMKKQEVAVEVFRKMVDAGLKDWELVLVGSYLPEDKDFVEALRREADKYPIKILTGISRNELEKYYESASIYWHLAGFGEDLIKHPERAEHFGITTLEAMTSGAIPVVFNAGGQKELVDHASTGFLWNTLDELVEITNQVIADPSLDMRKRASEKSREFSREAFCTQIKNLLRA